MSKENIESALIPHRVVEDVYIGDMSPLRAWRLYQSFVNPGYVPTLW
jgi:hypothetical protein